MMGGVINVESEPGKGSVFRFTVNMRYGQKRDEKVLNPGMWKNIRLLVVDDDLNVLDYFQDLGDQHGFVCDTTADGAGALELIGKKGPYDVYFIDWKMPGMDGIELARRIKGGVPEDAGTGHDSFQSRPMKPVVIMISAAEWSVIEEEAKEAGVDRFLSKPLFPSLITDCINECLGKTKLVPSAAKTGRTEHFEGYRVLLVEDMEINREIVITLLEPTGLTVDCAENGIEALELFEASPGAYDMIFMDVQMPEMDGYEATRRIRAFEKNRREKGESPRGIPIIAMTANVFREDVEKCLDAGMDGHVGKPLNIEELLAQLRKYLKSRSPRDGREVRA
jgi:CheY-like chemotaxis protein